MLKLPVELAEGVNVLPAPTVAVGTVPLPAVVPVTKPLVTMGPPGALGTGIELPAAELRLVIEGSPEGVGVPVTTSVVGAAGVVGRAGGVVEDGVTVRVVTADGVLTGRGELVTTRVVGAPGVVGRDGGVVVSGRVMGGSEVPVVVPPKSSTGLKAQLRERMERIARKRIVGGSRFSWNLGWRSVSSLTEQVKNPAF